jgi:hypothetical protein
MAAGFRSCDRRLVIYDRSPGRRVCRAGAVSAGRFCVKQLFFSAIIKCFRAGLVMGKLLITSIIRALDRITADNRPSAVHSR